MRERRHEKEQQLQEELLRGPDAEEERDDEHELHLDQLDDQEKRQEACQQLVL